MNALHLRLCLAAALLIGVPQRASATWSIIIVDKRSGWVGVAGASCTVDVHGIMTFVPGTGALVAQAIGHPPAIDAAIRLLRAGVSPDSILRAITAASQDTATHQRQYAIATLASGQAQFSGSGLPGHHGERREDGVLVQGNLLASAQVLDDVMRAIRAARSAGQPMEEVLMAGLKAGADAGGDSRCGSQRATSAFLSIARPGEHARWPYLSLRVVDVARGSSVRAVDLLQVRLAVWKANGGPAMLITSETVRPDSVP